MMHVLKPAYLYNMKSLSLYTAKICGGKPHWILFLMPVAISAELSAPPQSSLNASRKRINLLSWVQLLSKVLPVCWLLIRMGTLSMSTTGSPGLPGIPEKMSLEKLQVSLSQTWHQKPFMIIFGKQYLPVGYGRAKCATKRKTVNRIGNQFRFHRFSITKAR